MVIRVTNISLSSKRESLAHIHGRYQRAGRLHKSRILDAGLLRKNAGKSWGLGLIVWEFDVETASV
jgi:hypothetical protein